jgi:hypothetical protein
MGLDYSIGSLSERLFSHTIAHHLFVSVQSIMRKGIETHEALLPTLDQKSNNLGGKFVKSISSPHGPKKGVAIGIIETPLRPLLRRRSGRCDNVASYIHTGAITNQNLFCRKQHQQE